MFVYDIRAAAKKRRKELFAVKAATFFFAVLAVLLMIELAEARSIIRDTHVAIEETAEEDFLLPVLQSRKKPYADYRSITATGTRQYSLMSESGVYTDAKGFRKIGGRYMVAIDHRFGEVGDHILVEMANGIVFDAVVADYLDETEAGLPVMLFFVDTEVISEEALNHGDMSLANKMFTGRVVRFVNEENK